MPKTIAANGHTDGGIIRYAITTDAEGAGVARVTAVGRGFSLLECLCCLTLFAVIGCIAMPYVEAGWLRQQVLQRCTDVQDAVQAARLLASTQQDDTQLAPLSVGRNWSSGLCLARVAEPARCIMTWRWAVQHIQVSWFGFESRQRILFSASPMHARSNGSFLIEAKSCRRQLVLNRLGDVHVAHNFSSHP